MVGVGLEVVMISAVALVVEVAVIGVVVVVARGRMCSCDKRKVCISTHTTSCGDTNSRCRRCGSVGGGSCNRTVVGIERTIPWSPWPSQL
eukprot:2343266-Pyramimonas_sp.AAC.1